jgi:Fibronectin type III domain.
VGLQLTAAKTAPESSYPGSSSAVVFSSMSMARFRERCAGAGVRRFRIGAGIVSVGAVSGPPVFVTTTANFAELSSARTYIQVIDPAPANLTWTGNLPAGISLVNPPGSPAMLKGTPEFGTAGTYPITIDAVDAAGLSTSQNFVITVAPYGAQRPRIDSVDPSGARPGQLVHIAGANLTNRVSFGDLASPRVDVVDSGHVVAEIPNGIGTVDVIDSSTTAGTSAIVPADQFTYHVAPRVPALGNITPRGTGAFATWAPPGQGDQVDSYTLNAQVSSGFTASVPPECASPASTTAPGGNTGAPMSGLCASIPYSVTITATNSYGTSEASPPSDPVAPLPPAVPGSPIITDVFGHSHSLVVHWTAPSDDGGSPLTSYTVKAYSDADPTVAAGMVTVDPTATSAEVGTPVGATGKYRVAVTADNLVGSSVEADGSGTVATSNLPASPAYLDVEPAQGDSGGTVLRVRWSPPTDWGSGNEIGYQLTYTRDGTTTRHTISLGFDSCCSYDLFQGINPTAFYNVSISAVTSAGAGPAISTRNSVSPTVTLQPSVIQLSAGSMPASDTDGTLIWHSPLPPQVAALQSGNVVSAAPTFDSPNGLAVIVQSVTINDTGDAVVMTTAAPAAQMYSKVSFSTSGTPPGGLNFANPIQAASPGIIANSTANVDSISTIPIEFNCGDNSQVSICGEVGVKPYVDAGAHISIDCPHWYTACYGGSIDADAHFGVGLKFYEKFNARIHGTTPYTVWPSTPVAAVPTPIPGLFVTLEVGLDLELSGELSVSQEAGGDVYVEEGWSTSDGFYTKKTSDLRPPNGGPPLEAAGRASISLIGKFSVCVEGIVCGTLSATTKLTVTVNFPVPSPGNYFSLCADESIGIGLELHLWIFGDPSIGPLQLADVPFGCFTIGSPPTTLAVQSSTYNGPARDTCLLPRLGDVRMVAKVINPPSTIAGYRPSLTWSLRGSVIGDTISPTGVLTTVAPANRVLDITARDLRGGFVGVTHCRVGVDKRFDAPSNLQIAPQLAYFQGRSFATGLYTISWSAPATIPRVGGNIARYRITVDSLGGRHQYETPGNITRTTVSDDLFATRSFPFPQGSYTVTVVALNTFGFVSPPLSGTFSASRRISSVTFQKGTVVSPTVTVTGVGFGRGPFGAPSVPTSGSGSNLGSNYADGTFGFKTFNVPNPLRAGFTNSSVGLVIQKWSDREIVFSFGSSYGSNDRLFFFQGDPFTLDVNGLELQSTVNYP